MEPQVTNEPAQVNEKNTLYQVTPLSKYLAMVLFVILPFVGGWIGYTHAPEKIVEVEKITIVEKPVDTTVSDVPNALVSAEGSEQSVVEKGLRFPGWIDLGQYSLRYETDQMEVINCCRHTLPQSLVKDGNDIFRLHERAKQYPENIVFLTNYDVNYDHYLDVGILTAQRGDSDKYYDFFVFDPETNSLVKSDFLSGVSNPKFNVTDRTFSTSSAEFWDAQYRDHTEYRFDGSKYVKSRTYRTGNWEE